MQINPEDHIIKESEIRDRFYLSDNDKVFRFGYEYNFSCSERSEIQKSYDLTSLFVRLRPDFLIQQDKISFLVEAKGRTSFIEAAQLFINKQLEKIGVNVGYSFPNKLYKKASEIPFDEVLVPPKYRDEFEEKLKPAFLRVYPDLRIKYIKTTNGSGDPFVMIKDEIK